MSLQSKIKTLPDSPGVYFFLDKKEEILYVGKATSLRDRVKSYFGKDVLLTRGPLIEKMVSEAKDIKYERTDSVLEALILEANLIKKHKPKYNSLGKDDKSWNYVAITDEEFPRILTIRGREIEQKNIKDLKIENCKPRRQKVGEPNKTSALKITYGPYPHGAQLRQALEIVRKIFPFRDQKSKNLHNERFYRQIGLAPDTSSKEAGKEYRKTIRNIKLFFEGKKQNLIKLLEKEMREEARKRNFEKAGELRNKIFALNHIQDISLLKNQLENYNKTSFGFQQSTIDDEQSAPRIEAYDIAHISGKFVVGAMVAVENGELGKSEYRKFKIKEKPGIDDTGALKEILERRFSHPEWPIPKILAVDGGIAQKNIALKVLESLNISGIEVVAVTKNAKHKPEKILGKAEIVNKHKNSILLANNEAHRFVLAYHRQLRGKLK